jgi:hypothetical protein
VRCLPPLLSLGVGISVNNAHAVLGALLRRPAEFARTPKYRIEGRAGDWRAKGYRADRSLSAIGEALLAAYYAVALVFAARSHDWTALPFLLVFFNGFAYTAAVSLAPIGATPRTAAPTGDPETVVLHPFPIPDSRIPVRAEAE